MGRKRRSASCWAAFATIAGVSILYLASAEARGHLTAPPKDVAQRMTQKRRAVYTDAKQVNILRSRHKHGRALDPAAPEISKRIVRPFEGVDRRRRFHAGLECDAKKFNRILSSEIGD